MMEATVLTKNMTRNMSDMITKRWIEVQIVKEGVHYYPAATTEKQLADVHFLGNEHFHYFYITVRIEVTHNDRCIEFIQFRRYLESLFSTGVMTMNFKSCEMLAEDLINIIGRDYPARDMKVKVFEDNINGAILEYQAAKWD